MSIELDQVRELRPDVPSPTSHAREAARDQLRMAVAREVETTTRSSQPAPPHRSRRRQLHRLGPLLAGAGSVAVVVAVGAMPSMS
jgi:hypothetical protein